MTRLPDPDLDRELMALADQVLDEPRARELREQIAADPVLADRLAMYRESRALLRTSRAQLQLPPPSPALAALGRQLAGAPVGRPPRRRHWRFAMAVAAGVLASMALNAWRGTFSSGRLDPALAAALAATPSGEAVTLGASELLVLGSHQLADGRYCRDYRLSPQESADAQRACITAAGRWRARPAPAAAVPGEDGYRLAGATPPPEGRRLDEAEEARLIARGWRP